MSDEPEEPTPAPEESAAGDVPSEPQEPAGEVAPAEDAASASAPSGAVAIGQGKLSEADDKTFGLLAHLLGGISLIVGPIIIWMIKKDESPFVDDQGREAVNWQIGVIIGFVALAILANIPGVGCFVPLLFPVLGVGNLIMCILAGVEANKGKVYRYPFNLRLIK